ncbi:MAG: hypothetical protein GTO71_05690 [Woeseiaceae bacterium]|nr:hypothetical protein [Woeseiaceae bacterium]NIP20591.1 hypothetical protein [Woeseiaceae bacterium]NIS89384.1 hypothetical protein [Woeseiaceae bacterium]
MSDRPKSIVRLPRRHRGAAADAAQVDVIKLINEQSLRNAALGGLIVIVLFSVLWAMFSTLLGRIFPWMTVLLGVVIGLVMRRAGRGLDWRFPALAACMATVGALAGNVYVAAAFTADKLGAGTLEILRAVTSMTWPVYFSEVISAADIVYGLMGAGAAAFYANRRLTRSEYSAWRKWCEGSIGAGRD